MADLRFGSVPYLNSRPLLEGLSGVTLDVPSALRGKLASGVVDVALLSSVEALRNPEHPVVPGICIASPGPVDSVLLFSRGPLRDARRVLLDDSSLTSSALARILLAGECGDAVEYGACPPSIDPRDADADAVLLIGDPALRAPRDGLVVTDLASWWRETHGLPFCFAVWIARDEAAARDAAGPLEDAMRRGLLRREDYAREAARETGLPYETLVTYLTERIRYTLGDAERESLARFGRCCEELGLL